MRVNKVYLKIEGVGYTSKGERLQIAITKELVRELSDAEIYTALNQEIINTVNELKTHITLDFDSAKAIVTGVEEVPKRFDDRKEIESEKVKEDKKVESPFLNMLETL